MLLQSMQNSQKWQLPSETNTFIDTTDNLLPHQVLLTDIKWKGQTLSADTSSRLFYRLYKSPDPV